MMDSSSYKSGNISTNEEVFKNENNTMGEKNMEHFIINRDYTYALYMDDGETIDVQINLPRKYRKNIATIANYILMDSEINRKLKNRPVYEKIEMIEGYINELGIDAVIPSAVSQKHYHLIKKYLHDESKYPQKYLAELHTKKDKRDAINNYYQLYFDDEFKMLLAGLENPETIFVAEMKYHLKKIGFTEDGDSYKYETDNVFSDVTAEIDVKGKRILVSTDLYNPFYGEDNNESKAYSDMLEKAKSLFIARIGQEPEISLSTDSCLGCPDESCSFMYDFEPDILHVNDFLRKLDGISCELQDMDIPVR